MASTKTWALLTQSLFISMVGAARVVVSELETSLRKEAADKMHTIFKDNQNVICGGTEIHNALAKARSVDDMLVTNWGLLIHIADVYLGTVGLENSKKERCQADRDALTEFKKEMDELNKGIDDARSKVQLLASKVEEAETGLDDMFGKQSDLTAKFVGLEKKLAEKVEIEEGLKMEMAIIKEQEPILKAALIGAKAAFNAATSQLDTATAGSFEPDTVEASHKKLTETLTQRVEELKKTLSDLLATKRSTWNALNEAITATQGTQNEVNLAKGELEALNKDIAAAELNVETMQNTLDAARTAWLVALRAFMGTYKKGSNLGF